MLVDYSALKTDAERDCARLIIGVLDGLPPDHRRRVIAGTRAVLGLDDALAKRPRVPDGLRTSRSHNRFRERELARAVRAAKSAGGERVEVDPTTGKISVLLTEPKPDTSTTNELDQWLKDRNARQA
jgi:hypothetical protein